MMIKIYDTDKEMSLHEVHEYKDLSSSVSLLTMLQMQDRDLQLAFTVSEVLMLTEPDQMQDEGLLSLVWSDVIWR